MKMSQISKNALFMPKFGILDPLTEAVSDDVTMTTSWWNTSGMLRMSKIPDICDFHKVKSKCLN